MGMVIMQILLRLTYCWDFMGVTSLSCLEDTVSRMALLWQSLWLMGEVCNYPWQEPEPNMAEIQMENITWCLFICSQYHLI